MKKKNEKQLPLDFSNKSDNCLSKHIQSQPDVKIVCFSSVQTKHNKIYKKKIIEKLIQYSDQLDW